MGVTLAAGSELQEGTTYLLPLKATSSTEGITLSEKAQHAVYLVKDLRAQGDAYKGPDAVRNVCYFEVNDTNPLNALEFVLKDSGKLFFDDIILFSANINYNAETGRVYVLNNPNVQFLLDNNEQFLQPLRKRGMKVILGILGNHDAAGVAQLSDMGCREFAKELAAYCNAYNLDGVGFDDEYSNSPDLSNPWFAPWSSAAASRLLYETKKAMPDKTVMVYYLGAIGSRHPLWSTGSSRVCSSTMPSPITGEPQRRCPGHDRQAVLRHVDRVEPGQRGFERGHSPLEEGGRIRLLHVLRTGAYQFVGKRFQRLSVPGEPLPVRCPGPL